MDDDVEHDDKAELEALEHDLARIEAELEAIETQIAVAAPDAPSE